MFTAQLLGSGNCYDEPVIRLSVMDSQSSEFGKADERSRRLTRGNGEPRGIPLAERVRQLTVRFDRGHVAPLYSAGNLTDVTLALRRQRVGESLGWMRGQV